MTSAGHGQNDSPLTATGTQAWPLRRLLLLWALLSIGLLAVDAFTPLGLGTGSLYALLVITALWAPWRRSPIALAAWASVLTALGFVLSPSPSTPLPELLPEVNRAIALVIHWSAALILLRYKRIEASLTKLQAAVGSATDAVVIASVQSGQFNRIEYVNEAFCRLFGYSAAEAKVLNPDRLCATEADQPFVRDLAGALRTGGPVQVELACRTRNGDRRTTEWHVAGLQDDRGDVVNWVAIIRDVTEKRRIERALQESERRALRQVAELETLYHTAPIGLAMLSTDLRYVKVNDRLAKMNGVAPVDHIGRRPRDVVPSLADAVEPLVWQVIESGQPVLDSEIGGETGSAPGVKRIWRQQLYPVAVDGAIEGVGMVMEEITEQKRSERHLKLVMEELNHRVRNSLAVVQSIVSQTIRSSSSPATLEDALVGRIRALASAHSLLTANDWRCAELRELVQATVRPYRRADRDNVEVAGPWLPLAPSSSLALSLVIHELTTNAVKYGALSSPTGRVRIRWSFTDAANGRDLVIEWLESGGPPVTPPSRAGFGSQLIEFTVQHEFDGSVSAEFQPAGLHCTITIPRDKLTLAALAGSGE